MVENTLELVDLRGRFPGVFVDAAIDGDGRDGALHLVMRDSARTFDIRLLRGRGSGASKKRQKNESVEHSRDPFDMVGEYKQGAFGGANQSRWQGKSFPLRKERLDLT